MFFLSLQEYKIEEYDKSLEALWKNLKDVGMQGYIEIENARTEEKIRLSISWYRRIDLSKVIFFELLYRSMMIIHLILVSMNRKINRTISTNQTN